MAIDVERFGGNTPGNHPEFRSQKDKSDFDEVYEYLVDVSWKYQDARAAHRQAAGLKPHFPRKLHSKLYQRS